MNTTNILTTTEPYGRIRFFLILVCPVSCNIELDRGGVETDVPRGLGVVTMTDMWDVRCLDGLQLTPLTDGHCTVTPPVQSSSVVAVSARQSAGLQVCSFRCQGRLLAMMGSWRSVCPVCGSRQAGRRTARLGLTTAGRRHRQYYFNYSPSQSSAEYNISQKDLLGRLYKAR